MINTIVTQTELIPALPPRETKQTRLYNRVGKKGLGYLDNDPQWSDPPMWIQRLSEKVYIRRNRKYCLVTLERLRDRKDIRTNFFMTDNVFNNHTPGMEDQIWTTEPH